MDSGEFNLDKLGHATRPDDDVCRACGGDSEPNQLPNGRWMPPPAKCEGCRDESTTQQRTDRDIWESKYRRAVTSERHRDEVREHSPELVDALSACVDTSDGGQVGPSVYLWGDVGTGKTLQAAKSCAVYLWNRVVLGDDLRASARMVSEPKLFARLRASFDRDDETVDGIMGEYRDADLLVVDDFGVANPSSWVAENMYLLVDQRYEAGRPVIFTSNFSPGQLEARGDERTAQVYDERITSRIGQMVSDRVVELTEDYRAGAGD